LKAIFFPETPRLKDPLHVEMLQDQAQLMLYDSSSQSPGTKLECNQSAAQIRFGKCLLLLPLITDIKAAMMEKVFFKKTIGENTSLASLLVNMYSAN